jgi:ectoine hydroxylase-related dioxygenase (phytanoyl-CoA dioxygenase family)
MSATPITRYRRLRDARPLFGQAKLLRQRAQSEGYLFLPGVVERDAVLALRRKVLEACQRRGWLAEGTNPMDAVARESVRIGALDDNWIALQCELLPTAECVCLGRSPVILETLETLFMGAVATDQGTTCRIFSPNAPELTTPPHQDHYFLRRSTQLWTAWFPLGDCPRAQGGLAVMRGSNQQGLLSHVWEDTDTPGATVSVAGPWATADYACGDVLLFNCLTVHRALHNTVPRRLRISADYRYMPAAQLEKPGT